MNITDQLPVYYSTSPKSQAFSEGFMTLLDKPKQPVQDDGYYWQHQDQLQQSALTFDKLNDLQIKDKVLCDNSNSLRSQFESQELMQTTTLSVANESLNIASVEPEYLSSVLNEQLYSITVPVTYLSPIVFKVREQIVEPNKETFITSSELEPSATTLPVLKKHHLFVEQQQAELSLNAYDLPPKEQKQLIAMVKSYLKKKGLSLKKLMINGVSHD